MIRKILVLGSFIYLIASGNTLAANAVDQSCSFAYQLGISTCPESGCGGGSGARNNLCSVFGRTEVPREAPAAIECQKAWSNDYDSQAIVFDSVMKMMQIGTCYGDLTVHNPR